MRNKGFTLIELMIAVVIIGILAAILKEAYDAEFGTPDSGGTEYHEYYSVPPTPQCIEGYKALDGRQMLDSQGRGIPCG